MMCYSRMFNLSCVSFLHVFQNFHVCNGHMFEIFFLKSVFELIQILSD
jgi:hypothetical protein